MSLIGKALGLRNQLPPVPLGDVSGFYKLPGLAMNSNQDEALLRAFGLSGTVYANVSLLASSVAAQDWRLYEKAKVDGRARYTTNDQGSDQRKEVIAKSQALKVLSNPNPFWTRSSLIELSGIWMEAVGKSHWVVEYDPRASFPVGLWPVRPDRMTPVPDPKTYLKGWVYTAPDGMEKIPLRPQDVIFNRYPDPLDVYGGMGPLQSVLTSIDAQKYAAEWNRNFFINSARPDGVLSADHRIEDDEWDEISERWRESHRGVGRAHRIAVLEGVTWVPTSTSVKDMDFANLTTNARDIIREALGMHKVMTGVTDDVNRANAQTGEEVFASWKVTPRLNRWRDVLNTQFLPLFYPPGTPVPYEFDYVYPMPANREQDNAELTAKTQAASVLVDAGWDPDDVLQAVGLPKMKVAEKATQAPALPPGWVPAAPAGAPAGPEGAPAAPDATGGGSQDGDDMQNRLRQMAAWNALAGVR